nr:hypothetical protein [Parabacteroides goldsteinii]
MNAKENYQTILNNIFGTKAPKITIDDEVNNVTEALNNLGYQKFKENFIARLNRLKTKFEYSSTYKELLDTIKEIEGKNWTGAYAELAAYDSLQTDLLSHPIQLNVTLDNKISFAKEMNCKKTNIDGYIGEYRLYFDVKRLSDNTKEILDKIINEVKTQSGKKCIILPEYPLDANYENYQKEWGALKLELTRELKNGIKFIKSTVIPELSYRISWGAGVTSVTSTYSPYRHAENMYRQVLIYTKKFIKKRSFFLVFVNFPWYNQAVVNGWNYNKIYYRAVARRIFCQYQHITTPMKQILSEFQGNETVYDVTKKITGIIFIDDNCISSEIPSSQNTTSYIFLNPNADNKPSYTARSYIYSIAGKNKESEIDDFDGDNY